MNSRNETLQIYADDKPKARVPVQIAGTNHGLYVLADDGTMWVRLPEPLGGPNAWFWRRIKPLPTDGADDE